MTDKKEPKEGYIFDFISDQEIKAAPEEIQATQVFSKRLVDEYEYQKEEIQTRPQYFVRRTPSDESKREYPVDIAIFNGKGRAESDLIGLVDFGGVKLLGLINKESYNHFIYLNKNKLHNSVKPSDYSSVDIKLKKCGICKNKIFYEFELMSK